MRFDPVTQTAGGLTRDTPVAMADFGQVGRLLWVEACLMHRTRAERDGNAVGRSAATTCRSASGETCRWNGCITPEADGRCRRRRRRERKRPRRNWSQNCLRMDRLRRRRAG